MKPITPEELARAFHDIYERLAPQFGYETRAETARPWDQLPTNNRRLMIAVAEVILTHLHDEEGPESDALHQSRLS